VHNAFYGTAGTTTLTRTLVSGNTASTGAEIFNDIVYFSGAVLADNFNLFGTNGDAGVVGFSPGPTDIVPADGVTLGDILEPLTENGGPTKTHALVAGSPAVDRVARHCPPPRTDQRGFRRPVDGDGDHIPKCDIGAFEFLSRGRPK
jgi:hypothetical protein